MEDGPPFFKQDTTCPALLSLIASGFRIRDCHPLSLAFPDHSALLFATFGLLQFRSPLLPQFRLISFPRVTEMFHFSRFASHNYFTYYEIMHLCIGFPHSDITGFSLLASSPVLFAGLHVLLRLQMPRHPPCALLLLTIHPSVLCFRFNVPSPLSL